MESLTTLRSALKVRRSYHEPLLIDDNIIDLVEYPNYYSLMVLNFASSLTQNVEQIFYKFILELKRHDIIVITMQDIVKYLEMMHSDPKYANMFGLHKNAEEEDEVEEEEENMVRSTEANISIEHMIMVIRLKIEAAVQENDRIIAQREALSKFNILDYWNTGVGVSKDSLAIVGELNSGKPGKGDSKKKSEKGTGKKPEQQPEKTKKSKRKSKTDMVYQNRSIDDHTSIEGFTYEITDYDYTSQIWSKLTERGQSRFNQTYIEDFPVMGPKLYIILLNFRNTDLMIRLIEEGFYLNTIMQVLPFGALDIDHTWNLIDISKRRMNIFKSVSFIDHYIAFSDKPIKCHIDQMNAYNLICYMIYDADDIRRQHQNFLSNCNLIKVEDDINVFVQLSEIEFLFSNEVEFYLINLYNQIGGDLEEGEEEDDENTDDPNAKSKNLPISFTLFNNRFQIVENSYNFFKKNQSLDNINQLSEIFYDFVSNTNKTFFMNTTKFIIESFDFSEVKFVKNLTKYAFNEIVFQLNTSCFNKKNLYYCNYYEIAGGPYEIVHYKYNKKKNCDDSLSYCKTILPTQLCHRDFKEFLVDEIQPWLKKQDVVYNDLVQSFLSDKVQDDQPRHIEFKMKFVKEHNFIFQPSIKLENYKKKLNAFETLKLKEYEKVFEYLDQKKTSFSSQTGLLMADSSEVPSKKSKRSNKKTLKTSITDPLITENRPSIIKNRRISDIQPFDELDEEDPPSLTNLKFLQLQPKVDDVAKRAPVKAFNVFDLGDTRYQIDVNWRKFHFKNGCLRHCLDDLLYREKYQSLRLRFCWNRFYINRIFLDDVHDHLLVNYVRIITENETIINLFVNEKKFIEKNHTGWTPSTDLSASSTNLSDEESVPSAAEDTQCMYNVSFVLYWPNGLKIHMTRSEELNENLIIQEWCEVEGRDNERKRWYLSTGCCVAFCLNFVIKIYTAHGVYYEIGGEEETESSGNFEDLERIYEFELNYLTFLSKVIMFDQFNLTLSNGCKIYVKGGKIIKYLSEKPDKLLVKEHMDYVTGELSYKLTIAACFISPPAGEILIRREDGFKMLFKANEQIVIYPDGTIIKTGQLEVVENLDDTHLSEASSMQSETDVMLRKQSIVSYLVKQVIKFTTRDHFQVVNRKHLYFFHENYSTVQWDIDSNIILFDNYDRSMNIVYNDGTSIEGSLKNNYVNDPRPEHVEDLKFQFNTDHMKIDHKDFSSKINFHNHSDHRHDHILMTLVDQALLHRVEVLRDGKLNVIKNYAEKCVCKMAHHQKPLEDTPPFDERTFLICRGKEDKFFELLANDIKRNQNEDIVKDDDGNIFVLHNVKAETNSSFKSSSNLFARIPDTLATKRDDLCKLDDDTLELYEKQIKTNFFNKIPNRFGFAYYQKYSNDKLANRSYCEDNYKQIEMLSENAINYYVDQYFQGLIDERNAKLDRLKPSEVFLRKMREIDERHRLTNNYKIMLRYNIMPKYFDFHEHGDHIRNMDVSKYLKRFSRVRYSLAEDNEEAEESSPQFSSSAVQKTGCEMYFK